MEYGYYTTVRAPFSDVVARVTAALKTEGFGILSDIDLRKAMKEKLGEEVPEHRILGACNPPLAHRALQVEPNIGLLLPCNVTVRQDKGEDVVVGFLNPEMMVEATQNPELRTVAKDAVARLKRVRDLLSAGSERL